MTATKKLQTVGGNYTYAVNGNRYVISTANGAYLGVVVKNSPTNWNGYKTLGKAADVLAEAYWEENDEDTYEDEYFDDSAEIETEEEREERENREWEEERDRMQRECDERRDAEEKAEANLQQYFAECKAARENDARGEMEAWEKEKAAERAAEAEAETKAHYEAIYHHSEHGQRADGFTRDWHKEEANEALTAVKNFADLQNWWAIYSEKFALVRTKDGGRVTEIADWNEAGKAAELTLDNGKESYPFYHLIAKYFAVVAR